jgi:xanthine dehydrogenase accessory factor
VSSVVSAVDAARAVLAVAGGAPAVAVVTAARDGAPPGRLMVHADGTRYGGLGAEPLDEAGGRLAAAALDAGAAGAHEALVERVMSADGEWLLCAEAYFPPEHLVVVGAGHIAVPLARLGILLDFRVTVLDDREEFATTERFHDGVSVQRCDFAADPFAGIPLDSRSYVALVTRGHRWDFDCLQRLLKLDRRPRYIGMIGSRRRVRAAFHSLLEAGMPRSRLATVHAPIGLELGAETPAEIAVAIAAELVAIRRGAAVEGTAARERVLDRFLQDAT